MYQRQTSRISEIRRLGCRCMFCCRERKRLRDEAEADQRADLEAALPPVKEEARALFEMIGRDVDTMESIRELISVSPKIRASLLGYARHRPMAKRGILKVLDFRQKVAAEFERILCKHAAETVECPSKTIDATNSA